MNDRTEIKIEDQAYREHATFWTEKGDQPTVVGDYLGRLPSLQLIQASKGEVILDAGCGAGFIARHMALSGATVYGCDRNDEMLKRARDEENANTFGIKYEKADIVSLPYEDGFFDKVACIAVLIHDSPDEIECFFKESHRTLKSGGTLFVSIMHPFLFQEASPCRNCGTSWVQYKTLDEFSPDQSSRFNEDYRNAKNEVFSSVVWYHPESVLITLLQKTGFEVISSHSQFMTNEVLHLTNQSGGEGYPAFLQVVAQKV